jgi:uncharacterized protein (DUF58 family)
MSGERESGSPRAPATAALGAALTATGLGFGLTAALVCGLGLLGLAAGAVLWVELSVRRGRLERERGPGRIDERDPYPLRLRLRGTLLPPPGGELTDPLLDRPVHVGPRWRRQLARDVWLEGPGRRRLGAARLIVRDPLGLWRRELRTDRGADLVVLPRVEPVRWGDGGTEAGGRSQGSGSASDANARRGGLAQFEVDGLRPYRDGSPASRIHWPAVARTGEMVERRLIAGGDPRPMVVFDPGGSTDRVARERAMRAAASLCVALARAGGCDLLLPGERRPLTIDSALRSWPEAHTRIALTDHRSRMGSTAGLRGAVVLWVTSGRALPPSIRRLHLGSMLVTPHGSRSSAAFRVAGCFAYPAVASERRRPLGRAAA